MVGGGCIKYYPKEETPLLTLVNKKESLPDLPDSAERDDRTAIDKVIQHKFVNPSTRMILATGMTADELSRYSDNLLESIKPGWMFERQDDREGKTFAKPMDFAVLGPNTLYSSGPDEATFTRNFDIGKAIYFELDNHGRATPDELAKHIGGVNPELLFIVVNAMISGDYLTLYKEVSGEETLELVDVKVRDERRKIASSLGLENLREVDEENRYFLNQLPNYTSLDDIKEK